MKNLICQATSLHQLLNTLQTGSMRGLKITCFPPHFPLVNPNQKKAIIEVQREYHSDSVTQGDTCTEEIFHILNQP